MPINQTARALHSSEPRKHGSRERRGGGRTRLVLTLAHSLRPSCILLRELASKPPHTHAIFQLQQNARRWERRKELTRAITTPGASTRENRIGTILRGQSENASLGMSKKTRNVNIAVASQERKPPQSCRSLIFRRVGTVPFSDLNLRRGHGTALRFRLLTPLLAVGASTNERDSPAPLDYP